MSRRDVRASLRFALAVRRQARAAADGFDVRRTGVAYGRVERGHGAAELPAGGYGGYGGQIAVEMPVIPTSIGCGSYL